MEASDLEEKINTCHTGAVTYLGHGESRAEGDRGTAAAASCRPSSRLPPGAAGCAVCALLKLYNLSKCPVADR